VFEKSPLLAATREELDYPDTRHFTVDLAKLATNQSAVVAAVYV